MSSATSPMMRLIRELRRRRVFRTAALYIVGTWLVLQVADVIFPALDISERAIRYLLTGAVLGFPVALVFGWFYDVGTHGIRRTAPAGPEEIADSLPLRRLDYILLAVLASVVAAILFSMAGKVAEVPAQVRDVTREGPAMVAVLPFTTASKEGDNEFFATGIHDDLLTQLAQLQSIRVISRTSVMEYKDTVRNIRGIGRALGADAILEGGVQSAGNRIRINAQLIDTLTDEHLWAQTYDRELSATSIFDVQIEIAREITAALDATLTEQDTSSLDIIPTKNMAAYRAYRQAMDMTGTYKNAEYREILEEVVELDPGFTRAWMELCGHLSYSNFWGEPDLEDIKRAEEILGILQELAPGSVDHLIAQAYYSFYILKDYNQAFEIILRAEYKAPSDLKILAMKSWIVRRQGKHEDHSEVLRNMRVLDPQNSRTVWTLIWSLMVTHNYEEARQEIEDSRFDTYELSYLRNLLALREHRDYERYVAELIVLETEYESESSVESLWDSYIQARDYETAKSLLDDVWPGEDSSLPGLDQSRFSSLLTYWFLKDDDLLQESLREAHDHFDKSGIREKALGEWSLYFDLALLTAVEGKQEETARLIRKWRRGVVADATMKKSLWSNTCQILGIAGAVSEAIDCIRTGLVEASEVFPFLEPYLPFYDSIRGESEFIELLAELESGATSSAP